MVANLVELSSSGVVCRQLLFERLVADPTSFGLKKWTSSQVHKESLSTSSIARRRDLFRGLILDRDLRSDTHCVTTIEETQVTRLLLWPFVASC